jgi:hypothetical protein
MKTSAIIMSIIAIIVAIAGCIWAWPIIMFVGYKLLKALLVTKDKVVSVSGSLKGKMVSAAEKAAADHDAFMKGRP